MACVAGATVFLVLQNASVEPEELWWQSSREPGPKTTGDVPQACPWDDTSVAWKAHSPTCATFINKDVEGTAQQLSLWWHWGFTLGSACAWPTVCQSGVAAAAVAVALIRCGQATDGIHRLAPGRKLKPCTQP